MTATIFDIQRASFVDGPGIRTTVFFKGCNLRCAWCHNPESQSQKIEMLFHKNRCAGCGKCKEKCPNSFEKCDFCGKCALLCPHDAREICGKEYTALEVMSEIIKDKSLYENSGGGVTFSGGECMLQIDFLEELLKCCKNEGIHTAVDTAGHLPFEYFERIIPYTDLFLYDLKCFDADVHKKYTGVTNGLILENLGRLLKANVPLWVRIPIVPTVNGSVDEMKSIKAMLDSFGTPQKIELLPYHKMGEHKYSALGKELTAFSVPSEADMNRFKKIFEL
ncbi:MAG: glycyl-radical enzyme activating protein [Clostridia bacterium]|nr:glycyl-radical enzyme activating protein [Clostridia bacterium]